MLWLIALFTCGSVENDSCYDYRALKKDYATVFLNIEYFEPVVMITSEGKMELRNDSAAERFICFSLLGKNKGSYDVIAWDALDDTYIGQGRISDRVPLGIFSRQYNSYEYPNKFYSKPDYGSSYESDTTYIVDILRVLDCHGRWLKVEYESDGIKKEGWFPPEMQCDNVYSTCS